MGKHRCAEILPTASVWLRVSSLMSFCSPFYFPANNCCFACVSFHIPLLPSISCTFRLSLTFPPKILLSMPAPGISSSVLPFTSLYPFLPCTSFRILLPFPLMYFLSLLRFLTPYFPCLSLTFLSRPKILLSMPARGSSQQRSSFPFPLVQFLVLRILSCLSSIVIIVSFSSP